MKVSHDVTTVAIHAGRSEHSSAVPIYQGVTAPNLAERSDYVTDTGGVGGPTVEAFEAAIAVLEHAQWSVATASGQAAISLVLLALLQSGDRVVAHRCIYSFATRFLNEDFARKWGIEIEWVDMRDLAALGEALSKPTKLVYFEPIANPAMHLLDVAQIASLAKAAGAVVAVDNTLLSPYLLRPLELGVDVVLHSATKYIGGHGDALAGVVSGKSVQLYEQLSRMRMMVGSFLAPLSAFLMLRGVRTLPCRMDRHCANTLALVEYLQTRPEVESIRFAGVDARSYELRQRLNLAACGALFGFTLVDGVDRVAFRHALKLCRPWGSLGDVETLVAVPKADEVRDIPPNFVRVAVGLEAPRDIIADFEQGFAIFGRNS